MASAILLQGSSLLALLMALYPHPIGKDEASSLEVTWPDGRIFTRGLAEGEMNSVLVITYPLDEDSVTKPTTIECGQGFSVNENGHCGDTDECLQFPFVCPREKPICINTYGGYKCRPNRKCNPGYEPNEDGTACVAQVAYFGSYPSSAFRLRPAFFQSSAILLGLGLYFHIYTL